MINYIFSKSNILINYVGFTIVSLLFGSQMLVSILFLAAIPIIIDIRPSRIPADLSNWSLTSCFTKILLSNLASAPQ